MSSILRLILEWYRQQQLLSATTGAAGAASGAASGAAKIVVPAEPVIGAALACAAGTAGTIYCLNKKGCIHDPSQCCYFAGCQPTPQNLTGRPRNNGTNQGQPASFHHVNPLSGAAAGAGAARGSAYNMPHGYANELPYATPSYGSLPGATTESTIGASKGGKRRRFVVHSSKKNSRRRRDTRKSRTKRR